jgi:hypothetical protein
MELAFAVTISVAVIRWCAQAMVSEPTWGMVMSFQGAAPAVERVEPAKPPSRTPVALDALRAVPLWATCFEPSLLAQPARTTPIDSAMRPTTSVYEQEAV